MKPEKIISDKVLDTRGLSSPMPVLKMISALRSMAEGKIIEVWCTDPDFKTDYQELSNITANQYLGDLTDPDGYTRFFIQKIKNRQK